jgi:hypothetical protein
MNAALLSIHVLAAIVLIGPITAAASVFPRYARAGDQRVLVALHRISRGYAIPALAVPVFGIATASRLGVLGDAWVLVSMALTVLAGVLLVTAVLPGQRSVLAGRAARALPMATGLFALTWAVVVVLMIVRPGSTTGV